MTMSAIAIAQAVRSGRLRARDVALQCLAGLNEGAADPLRAVTRKLSERALHDAQAVDDQVAAGRDPGPLAGVPYGVKDLFDVAGLPTTAGSRIHADAPPAKADAEAIRRMKQAGAVLVATLNMDEFAYGFATINALHGTTRNPCDPMRLAGGSSGGSAAVVAAGLMPLALGSDTNGSVRVPASLTGVYGLKPGHGDLPLSGVFPFAESFDDVGPFAACAADMALVWEVLSGHTVDEDEGAPLRIARLGGRFRSNADPVQLAAIDSLAADAPLVELPDVAIARSAAFVITAFEGGRLHADDLARDPMAFDPQTRDRLLAGALLPEDLYRRAQAFRHAYRARVEAVMANWDVLLAPAAPCVAPLIDDPRILVDGEMVSARANLGLHSQPVSFTGLPSLCVPLRRPQALPLGLQLIGGPGAEPKLMRLARVLEEQGVIAANVLVAQDERAV